MEKATKLKAKTYKWATDQMKPGIIYSLYLKQEIIPVTKDKKKLQKRTYLKISHKTGARFISKVFICKNCKELFFVIRMQNDICSDCQTLERQRKAKEQTEIRKANKSNKKTKKKVIKEKKKTAREIAFEITGEYPIVEGRNYILEKSFDDIFDECEGMINA